MVVPHQGSLIAFFRRLVKGHQEDFDAIFQILAGSLIFDHIR